MKRLQLFEEQELSLSVSVVVAFDDVVVVVVVRWLYKLYSRTYIQLIMTNV